jgi:exosome complex component RRP46
MSSSVAAARVDGRLGNHIRPLVCIPGVLVRADGSARFQQGATSVIASVYGPGPIQLRKELLDRATIEVQVLPPSGLPTPAERAAEVSLRSSLEAIVLTSLHPRTLISVTIQVLRDDGALVPTCINAACMALADAGVPLRGTLSAVSCVFTGDGGICLDPTRAEEDRARAVCSFAFLVAQGKVKQNSIVWEDVTGELDDTRAALAHTACSKASHSVAAFCKQTIDQRIVL